MDGIEVVVGAGVIGRAIARALALQGEPERHATEIADHSCGLSCAQSWSIDDGRSFRKWRRT